MRNLTFLAAPKTKPAAAAFRRAFMQETAIWSVCVEECESRSVAAALLAAEKSHAFVASAPFRGVLLEAGQVKGASARLAQGADLLYRGGKNTLAISQLARTAIDEMERRFLPLYGAKAVVLGSGSAALDVAYECARAGVERITLLGAQKERTRSNLEAFLDAFGKERTQIIDTEQKREGHLSATRAYDNATFLFGAVSSTSSIFAADVVVCVDEAVPAALRFLPSQIVCDLCGRTDAFEKAAREAGCDFVSSTDAMGAWGRECAHLLVEFGRAEL